MMKALHWREVVIAFPPLTCAWWSSLFWCLGPVMSLTTHSRHGVVRRLEAWRGVHECIETFWILWRRCCWWRRHRRADRRYCSHRPWPPLNKPALSPVSRHHTQMWVWLAVPRNAGITRNSINNPSSSTSVGKADGEVFNREFHSSRPPWSAVAVGMI